MKYYIIEDNISKTEEFNPTLEWLAQFYDENELLYHLLEEIGQEEIEDFDGDIDEHYKEIVKIFKKKHEDVFEYTKDMIELVIRGEPIFRASAIEGENLNDAMGTSWTYNIVGAKIYNIDTIKSNQIKRIIVVAYAKLEDIDLVQTFATNMFYNEDMEGIEREITLNLGAEIMVRGYFLEDTVHQQFAKLNININSQFEEFKKYMFWYYYNKKPYNIQYSSEKV